MQKLPNHLSDTGIVTRLLHHVEAFFSALPLPKAAKLVIAYSGGLDSTVLLDILSRLRSSLSSIQAVHINHGISSNADMWEASCGAVCVDYNIPFQAIKVSVPRDGGLGLEAAARQLRYEALSNIEHDYIVLAHHQDDQAETVLLQMFRGAGPKGMAAMAAVDRERELLRPLLDISRADLEAYAAACQLTWVDDESNTDRDYDRNFCRHEILPLLTQRYPAIKSVLSRTASNMAEAAILLEELAQQDASSCIVEHRLMLEKAHCLSLPRLNNLVRWWLHHECEVIPSSAMLLEICQQLLHASPDADINMMIDHARGIVLKRYRNQAYLEVSQPISERFTQVWHGESEVVWSGGLLKFDEQAGVGIALAKLRGGSVSIRARVGGEKFKPDSKRPTRTLKHLLQEAGVPPAERERLPLIYVDEILVAVPSIGVATDYQATPQEAGLVIRWIAS